jgi:hypothetical protein
MTCLLARQGGPPGTDRDRPAGGELARNFSFRPAFRPALTFKGQQFKGQQFNGRRGFSGKPLNPDAIAHPEISEAAVLAERLRS